MRTVTLLLGLALGAAPAARGQEEERAPEREPVVLAVIVHPKNETKSVTMNELRAVFRLERQFWPDGSRSLLYLRPSESVEYKVLLEKVYRTTHEKLQKYWMRKLFSGEIPSKPSYVPSAKAAASLVKASEGAISVVLAKEVPKDVKVLLVDGKKPGEEGYPLAAVLPPDEEAGDA